MKDYPLNSVGKNIILFYCESVNKNSRGRVWAEPTFNLFVGELITK